MSKKPYIQRENSTKMIATCASYAVPIKEPNRYVFRGENQSGAD